MTNENLRVRMLGEFSLSIGQHEITDRDNRSRKSWLLLAYLIYCRSRAVTPDELVELLWSNDETSANPLNALKTMLHRVRASLDQLGDEMGHVLILRKKGTYFWNNTFPITLDVDNFETLCHQATNAKDDDMRLVHYLQALTIYRGDFLDKLSSEPWVVPLSAYYHNLYIQAVLESLSLLSARGRLQEIVDICAQAVVVEPYNEELYGYYLRSLLALNQQREVVKQYKIFSQRLLDNFGLLPNEELRMLNREALAVVNDRTVPMSLVMSQLKEPVNLPGALVCEYDFFKIIYQATARSVARSGDAAHLGLFTVTGPDGQPLSRRSLDVAMDNLQDTIQNNLRRGDIAARCSVCQFIVMLPLANYENSCMVCRRVVKAFQRQYPHSPATLEFTVQALEPAL
jgi:DNA-binding SARP family transcriptional activator